MTVYGSFMLSGADAFGNMVQDKGLIVFSQVPQDALAVTLPLNRRIRHGISASDGSGTVRTAHLGRNPGIQGRCAEDGRSPSGDGTLQPQADARQRVEGAAALARRILPSPLRPLSFASAAFASADSRWNGRPSDGCGESCRQRKMAAAHVFSKSSRLRWRQSYLDRSW